LDENFTNRWIGQTGTAEWVPTSPELNPMDFFSLAIFQVANVFNETVLKYLKQI
jgi:hypothetical protein